MISTIIILKILLLRGLHQCPISLFTTIEGKTVFHFREKGTKLDNKPNILEQILGLSLSWMWGEIKCVCVVVAVGRLWKDGNATELHC